MSVRISEFQPADPPERDEDAMWEEWFDQQERNGYVVATREELQDRINSACNDAYAEGRADEREESAVPDLLALARTYRSVLSRISNGLWTNDDLRQWMREADAVIAKADGKQ